MRDCRRNRAFCAKAEAVGGEFRLRKEEFFRARSEELRTDVFLIRSKPSSSVGFAPPPARLRAYALTSLTDFPLGKPDPQGVVEKPPQGKNACGAFAALARNTSLLGRQTNPRSSLGFDIHHSRQTLIHQSRQTLIHQSRLTRDDTPPSSRVGALARRIEGEPGRIGSASKGSALRYKRSFLSRV